MQPLVPRQRRARLSFQPRQQLQPHCSRPHQRSVGAFSRLRHVIALGLATAFAAGMLTSSPLLAEAATVGVQLNEMTFSADDANVAGGAALTGCFPSFVMRTRELYLENHVRIEGVSYPIHRIAENACPRRKLTKVTFPTFLKSIGGGAFDGNALTSVDLPSQVDTVMAHAFANNQITSAGLEKVKVIQANGFSGNQFATLATSPILTTIGASAFADNPITELDLSASTSLTTIGAQSFEGATLPTVTIPASVTSIGARAFANDALESQDIYFTGDAPTTFTAAGPEGSFGDAAGKTIHLSRSAQGFKIENGNWNGYRVEFLDHDVTFDTGGGSDVPTQRILTGSNATKPADPTRESYLFQGWYADEKLTQPFDFTTEISDNVTIYASWKLHTQIVTFLSSDTGFSGRLGVIHGKPTNAIPGPTRTGYSFLGWFTDEAGLNEYDFATPVTEDFTLYAKMQVNTYIIFIDPRGGKNLGSPTIKATYGSQLETPPEPTRAGYAFTGWFTDTEGTVPYDFSTSVSGSTTLYAGWETAQHTVRFRAQGGSANPTRYLSHEAQLTAEQLAAPTHDGHEFTGWFTDPEATTPFAADTKVTESIILYAGWKAITFSLVFDSQGGSATATAIITQGAQATPPSDPTRKGHTFAGWFTDSAATEKFDFTTAVTSDLTLFAGWLEIPVITYSVTFDAQNGADPEAQLVAADSAVTAPTDPLRDGYTFAGWFSEPEATTAFDFTTVISGDLTLYAGWDVVTYAVTFDPQNGSAGSTALVAHGKAVTAPKEPVRDGHTFTGWHTNPEATTKYTFETETTAAVTLYAGWQLNTYTVTFDSQSGSELAPAPVNHGEPLPEPTAPTREGFSFSGWYTDQEVTKAFDFTTAVSGDFTLFAGWNIINHAITFDPQNGTAGSTALVAHGKQVAAPSAPTREGYTFTGWYTDSEATKVFDFTTAATGDFALFAGWKVITHTITFNAQNDAAANTKRIAHGKPVPAPADPTRENYVFAGWYTSAALLDLYDFSTPATDDVTLYASWEGAPLTVTLTYGDAREPGKLTVPFGSRVTRPEAPTREGYEFAGWFTSVMSTNAYNFDATVTGPLSLYARWGQVPATEPKDPGQEEPPAEEPPAEEPPTEEPKAEGPAVNDPSKKGPAAKDINAPAAPGAKKTQKPEATQQKAPEKNQPGLVNTGAAGPSLGFAGALTALGLLIAGGVAIRHGSRKNNAR